MALNIDRSNTDPFYRYKMPRLVAKVEGKGNGIKTVIINMTGVAKALSRPPSYPTKFFGCELGAQTQFDAKNDRYIVNGFHTNEKLQTLLDDFIKKFVLCPECSNPETNLVVQVKRGTIQQRCIACGHVALNIKHKLTAFILKNPPDQDTTAAAAVAPSRDKRSKREKSGDTDVDMAIPVTTPTSGQEQMAAVRKSGHMMSLPPSIDKGADDDWGADLTEEAIKQRMDELSDAAKDLAFTDDMENSTEVRLNMIYELVKIKRDDDELTKPSAIKDLFSKAKRAEVANQVPLILVELLLNEKALAQIQKYKSLFLRFCAQNQKAQRVLLGGLEILISKEFPGLKPKTIHILKALYDLDILEEAVILEWGKKPSKRYISKEQSAQIIKEAQALLIWLEQAEEESEEDVEIIYSNTQKMGEGTVGSDKPVATQVVYGNNKTDTTAEEDDIDIDAI